MCSIGLYGGRPLSLSQGRRRAFRKCAVCQKLAYRTLMMRPASKNDRLSVHVLDCTIVRLPSAIITREWKERGGPLLRAWADVGSASCNNIHFSHGMQQVCDARSVASASCAHTRGIALLCVFDIKSSSRRRPHAPC